MEEHVAAAAAGEIVNPRLDSPLAKGLVAMFDQLQSRLGLSTTLRVYLAGGMAAHLYCGIRPTGDIDAEYSRRFPLPPDLTVSVDIGGVEQLLHFDPNYNPSFALLHENYQDDAVQVDIGVPHIDLRILNPTDLAVSKIARLIDSDRQDIHDLAAAGLLDETSLRRRALESLPNFIGNQQFLKLNIDDACKIVAQANAQPQTDLDRSPMRWRG